MKYRSKPFEVEAVQFDGDNAHRQMRIKWGPVVGDFYSFDIGSEQSYFHTYDTQKNLNIGDWIIKDGDNFSVCSEEEFKRKYEAVK